MLLSHTHRARSAEMVSFPSSSNIGTLTMFAFISRYGEINIQAPKHWMLDKLRGRWAPKPNAGPHKLREMLSCVIFGGSNGNESM